VNNLEKAFGEIAERVKLLLAQNARLKSRVDELEKELLRIRHDAQQVEHLHDEKLHIRKKIEHILRALESADGREQ